MKRDSCVFLVFLVLLTAAACGPESKQEAELPAIAFTRSNGAHVSQILATDPAGKTLREVVLGGMFAEFPTWSPDGKRIAFHGEKNRKSGIYVLDVRTRRMKRITAGLDSGPAWSPIGKLIAFVRLGERLPSGERPTDIFVVTPEGGEPVNLTRTTSSEDSLSWSPDGRRLAFQSNREGNNDIYVINADGAGNVRLTNHPADDFSPAWSPDDSTIAFTSLRDNDPDGDLYLMDPDGSEVRRITPAPGTAGTPAWSPGTPAWSPDGSMIVFVSSRSGISGLYVLDLHTKTTRLLISSQLLDSNPTWRRTPG